MSDGVAILIACIWVETFFYQKDSELVEAPINDRSIEQSVRLPLDRDRRASGRTVRVGRSSHFGAKHVLNHSTTIDR